MISLAHDLAERQILEGSASSQVITHFLKLGSSRERIEQQRIEFENQLTLVKMEQIEDQKRTGDLMRDALNAMRGYMGQEPPPEEIDEPD